MADLVGLIPREVREAIEQEYPRARFLSSEEQKKYDEAVSHFGEKAQDSLRVPIKGSNIFKVILLNDSGVRTVTLPELECALENGMPLQGTFEDTRDLILRSAGDSHAPNDYLAKRLAKDLKISDFGAPQVIAGLSLTEDGESAYGLVFKVTDKTQVIKAPDFDNRNSQRRFSKINPDYSIEFDNDATRTLYTRDNGVSRLCLLGSLSLDSRCEYLADSNDRGRVVVVSGAAASQKSLDQYISQIREESTRQLAEMGARAKKAENYLRTGKFE